MTALNGAWEVVIGLEIHAQLATKSKIFSGASTAYGAEPKYTDQCGRHRIAGCFTGVK